jgi:glycerophosphoryl diester phosphodiesterase
MSPVSSPQRIIHLVAHRGNAHDCPENTLAALRSALDLGARFLALDVQLACDGVPVVIRDGSLRRTTGREGLVCERTAAELLATEAAERHRFGARFAGTTIPSLADVVTLLEGHPELTLFVEIGRESVAAFGHIPVVSGVEEVLRPVRSQCVVISLDLPAVIRARHVSGMRVGWVLPDCGAHTRLKFEALQPDFLFCDYERLPLAGPLWRGPWQWAVREVRSLENALALAGRGAAFIATMAVRSMSAAMRAHAVQVQAGSL